MTRKASQTVRSSGGEACIRWPRARDDPRASVASLVLLSPSPGDERRVATYRSIARSESSRTRFTSLAVGKGALQSQTPLPT